LAQLITGDCVEVIRTLAEGSIAAVVTDPPYGISFMNKNFDRLGVATEMQTWHEQWLREAYRVLMPGGVIKAFSGTRTFHRLAVAMERVGFVLEPSRSLEGWSFGSGFPKSLNVFKAIEAHIGADGSEQAKRFTGYGTALKPAWEIFIVGRKP
jgi:site-specific DNA-methyltransferase (adenine-specific)